MKIELVTGGTTYEACLNTIKKIDVANLDYQNLVVVPDSFSMQAENLIFDVLNIESTMNIEVVGISRLASKILKKNNISFQRLSALEEIFEIFKVVKQNESKFLYFKKCNVDFCIKILQIIKQFKACKIIPEKLSAVGDESLDKKIYDLKLIYQEYEASLGQKLDLSKLLQLFLEKTENEINLTKINLFFVNFDSFSAEISSFICSLAKYVNQIFIGCAKPISLANAYIYEDDIMNKTLYFAKKNGVSVQVENNSTNLQREQLTMAKNLFAFEIEEDKSDFFVNLIAKNRKEEVEFVAKIIKNQIINGKKYKNFAIAVANKKYFELIKSSFQEYDLAFYCDDAVNLSQTVLGRFVLKLLELTKLDLSQEDFKYLCSQPLCGCDNVEEILQQIDFFNVQELDEFLAICPQAKKIIEKIDDLRKCKNLKDYINVLQDILILTSSHFQKFLMSLYEKKYIKEHSENEQSLKLITKTLEKLQLLGEEQEIELNNFQTLLALALTTIKVETVPSLLDAIYVGDITDSYFEDVDTLFVLGATSALPRTRIDNGIIDDDDIKKLKINFALEPEIKVINRRNRLKLFEVLQHAKNKLIVSTPTNEDGKASVKASFVEDLYKMFGRNVFYVDTAENVNLSVLNEQQKIEALLFYIGSKQNLVNAYTSLKGKGKLPKKYISSFKNYIKLNKSSSTVLSTETLHKFKKNVFSASQLESYFSCPFKHFINYILKIHQKENIEPNKRMFGVFQHALLKLFVEKGNLKTITESDLEKFLKDNVLTLAQNVYHKKILQRQPFLNYLFNESKIILKNVLKEQKYSEFNPFLLENKIFESLNDTNKLIGFVDRVDRCEDYFRIIDYKTGKTQALKKDLFYGKKLQLFLYADAIAKKTNLICAGVYYFDCNTKYAKYDKQSNMLIGLTKKDNEVVLKSDCRLEDENFKSDIIGLTKKKSAKEGEFAFKGVGVEENLNKLLVYANEVSLKAIAEIEQGYNNKKPIKDACKNCPYTSICLHSDLDGFRICDNVKDEDF